ncbi:hypothetical protein [Sphaerotilus mobilis]|uniref:Uncharacterized protein n=1 Tax=Sphaerotilus mobilis TaxID=47994 RepID=A0A4Q7LF71_9BURK|nr:hypothetical protein [Sphaerotilus mobilis]RZS51958.1 hypothetical protein EV685_3143 [Sphaerotilus mobilis]
MSLDPAAHRRRAALATFTPVLGEDALMDALWMLQDSLHGHTAREIISAVDRVAARHGIDAPTCKRLYEQFYRALSLADDQLPLDPWPVMQSLRPAAAPQPMRPAAGPAWPPAAPAWPAATGATPWAPVASAMAAQMQPAFPQAVPPVPMQALPAAPEPVAAPALPDAPPAVLVFEALIAAALTEVRQRHPAELHDLRDSAVAGLDGSRLGATPRNLVRAAWQRHAEPGAWRLPLNPSELGELVHLFYVALCEALGPVDADQVLTRSVREAEQIPAAQRHSPRQFL